MEDSESLEQEETPSIQGVNITVIMLTCLLIAVRMFLTDYLITNMVSYRRLPAAQLSFK